MSPDTPPLRGSKFAIRTQDILLTVLFATLIVLAHTPSERLLMAALAVLQLMEGRTPGLSTLRGRTIWTALQIVIIYLILYITGEARTIYYLLLLLPIVSTATYLG